MRKAINLLILIFTIAFFSCDNEQGSSSLTLSYENSDAIVEAAKKVITEISIEDFKSMYDGEDYFIIVDVRTVEEYDSGYIPGAVSIPRGVLEFRIGEEEVWDNLGFYIPEKSDQIILNCRSGGRSALATKALLELGYENVKSLQGGWNDWKEAYPDLIEKIITEDTGYQNASSGAEAAGGC